VGCQGKLRWQGDVNLGLNEEGCSPDKSLPGGASLASGKSGGGMSQVSGGRLWVQEASGLSGGPQGGGGWAEGQRGVAVDGKRSFSVEMGGDGAPPCAVTDSLP
jgi:hypothetical protein